jgi:hypothetical protein
MRTAEEMALAMTVIKTTKTKSAIYWRSRPLRLAAPSSTSLQFMTVPSPKKKEGCRQRAE